MMCTGEAVVLVAPEARTDRDHACALPAYGKAGVRSGEDEDPAPHSPAFEDPVGFGRLGEVERRADSATQAPDREHPVDRLRRFGEIGGRGIADREAEHAGIAGVELS